LSRAQQIGGGTHHHVVKPGSTLPEKCEKKKLFFSSDDKFSLSVADFFIMTQRFRFSFVPS
jgi:hypothetical protein